MRTARLRLASLWLSQCARVLADWCLRVTALAQWASTGRSSRDAAWHIATAVFIAPFLFLAPLNGYLSNSLPRRGVLAATSAYALAVVAACSLFGAPWMICLALVALGSAIYSPARYALLPAAAEDTRIALARVNGWIEMGGAASIIGGAALGWSLMRPGAPSVFAVLLGLNGVALLAAWPAAFRSDVLRREPPRRAVAGFWRDLCRVLRDCPARSSVLGLAAFQALVTASAGGIVARLLGHDTQGLPTAFLLVMIGAAIGCATASLQGHPRRSLGLVPWGTLGLLLALCWAALAAKELPAGPCVVLGFAGGLINVPLRSAYLACVPGDARGNAMAVMNAAIYLLTTVVSVTLSALIAVGLLPTPLAQLTLLGVLAAVGMVTAWYILLAPAMELMLEGIFWPMYRIRTLGPGTDVIPRQGPLLVVANHTAYADPFWIGKIAPRQLTPMMTSTFYDLPIVRWLMVHVVGAIRVQQARFRREAPELHEAVEVLRRGGAVLLFPEGMLRRTPEPGLRRFGQGVWHILHEMPATPVVVCWIEGGWGSFSSYAGGPPMKNKRLDWRRRIDIALEKPQVLDPALLADPLATRRYLMHACLECRRYLGLAVPAGRTAWPEGWEGEDEVAGGDPAGSSRV